MSLGVPAAQGARRPWSLSLLVALSSPFLCRGPHAFSKLLEDISWALGVFSPPSARSPRTNSVPGCPHLPGRGRAGSLCLKWFVGLGQLMSSFLILCCQTRKTFVKDSLSTLLLLSLCRDIIFL